MIHEWKKLEGQVLDNKFPLQNLLGSTSHSAVFLTQSPPPERKNIAVKLIISGAKPDFQASLLLRASKLSHPNLIRLLPGGRCRLANMDLLFMFMEHAESDLGRGLSAHPIGEKEAREVLGRLLDALRYIHSKGFAHSHIKPSNILAVGNQLKLSSDTVLPLGEPRPAYRPVDAYDAPEAASAPVAASSDVWSLGVTLVEVLTQQAPASSPENPSDPTVPSTIPQPFLDIAQHCLRRNPLERWTAAQIADSLTPVSVEVAAPREAVGDATTTEPPKEMWTDSNYCWVVVCKNNWFHRHPNIFNVHRIPLGETDAVLPRPKIDRPFVARCDECGKEYAYEPSEVLRYEMEVPASFVAHPLFVDSQQTDKPESTPSLQPTARKPLVRTIERVLVAACLTLIVAEFVLTNLPKLSAGVSASLRPNDPGALFNLYNKGLLPVYDVKAGCEVMRVDRPTSSGNGDSAEPTTVYFPDSRAEILSPGQEMAVPCGRAISINPDSTQTRAEMFFVVSYRPKGVWWHKSEKFPMETERTADGKWIWKSIPR